MSLQGATTATAPTATASSPNPQVGDNNIMVSKSTLDNIVGNLWQARQESSGSSQGNQVNKFPPSFLIRRSPIRRQRERKEE